jgi:hypothetical protein
MPKMSSITVTPSNESLPSEGFFLLKRIKVMIPATKKMKDSQNTIKKCKLITLTSLFNNLNLINQTI